MDIHTAINILLPQLLPNFDITTVFPGVLDSMLSKYEIRAGFKRVEYYLHGLL